MITIMQIIKDGHGATGEELNYIFKDRIKKFNEDAKKYDEELLEIEHDKNYTHEEVLDLGMLLSKEVRNYVIGCEREVNEVINVKNEEESIGLCYKDLCDMLRTYPASVYEKNYEIQQEISKFTDRLINVIEENNIQITKDIKKLIND